MKRMLTLLIAMQFMVLGFGDVGAASGEKGLIRVSTDQEGAYIYVNGKKKAMTGDKGLYTDIFLSEGEYEIRVERETEDGNYVHRGVKNVFVGADTSVKMEIETEKEPTEKKLRKDRANAEKALRKDRANAEKALKSMNFVRIQPGTFMMGSPGDEPDRGGDETRHKVTISKAFRMQTTEVTQAQWKAVMGDNPSRFKDCGGDCPVEEVSWYDIQEFIKKLNRITGQTYRLPTEAEWEYACRAGTTTPFNTGSCLSTDQANYDGNHPYKGCGKGEYRKKTVPVASFPPNAWGLYDMHGNVYEWCQDWKGDYPSGHVTDPSGPLSGASYRVLRGGSWRRIARRCRSADRGRDYPSRRDYVIGFRLALPPGR